MKHFIKVLLSFFTLFLILPLYAEEEEKQYIGYAQSQDGEYVYSTISSGQGVQKYYVVPDDIYNSDLSQEMIISESTVAYCFNYHNHYPPCFQQPSIQYSFLSNASIEAFDQAVTQKRVEGKELYANIIRIVQLGYPNDLAGIQENYHLNDDAFRFLTQYALWYYTDSMDLRFKDGQITIYEKETAVSEAYSYTEPLEEAWHALLETENPSTDTSYINLYQPVDPSYQYLLTAGSLPQAKTISLSIQKEIVSDAIDETKTFLFHVKLYDSLHQELSGTFPLQIDSSSSWITFENGEAEFSLSHNQTAKILSLPENIYYEVYEEETEGYTVIIPEQAKNTTPLSENVFLLFRNVRDTVSLTIRKTVENDSNDSTPFSFQLSLHDAEDQPLTGEYPVLTNDQEGLLALQEGMCSFTLTNGQSITFPSLPAGTKYVIQEAMTDHYSIVSENPKTSSLQEDTTVAFVNRKKETMYEANLHASKTYTDGSSTLSLRDAQFRFLLKDQNDQQWEAVNDAEGNILFPTLYYQNIGQYEYTIQEDPSYQTDDSIEYDSSCKHVVVTVGNKDVISLIQGKTITMDDQEQLLIDGNQIEGFGLDAFHHSQGTYSYQRSPSIDQRLQKLFYFQHTHPYGTMIRYYSTKISWNADLMQRLVLYLSGVITSPASYYEEVFSSILLETETIPDNYELVLFTSEANDRLLAGFEHSVSIQYESEPVFINTKKQGELIIQKTVSGTNADTDASFAFAVTIKDASGNPVFTSTSSHILKDAFQNENPVSLDWKEGKTTFSLKHNESMIFSSLPLDFSYSVTEIDADGYTATYPKDPCQNEHVDQANVVINNHRDQLEYSLKVIKINPAKERLQGVGFTLNQSDPVYTDANGEIIFYGLQEGTYTLKEVKTITGYTLLKDPVVFQISHDGTVTSEDSTLNIQDHQIVITITNITAPSTVPNLGGSGDLFYLLIPLIGMIAICIYMKYQEKKDEL